MKNYLVKFKLSSGQVKFIDRPLANFLASIGKGEIVGEIKVDAHSENLETKEEKQVKQRRKKNG